MMLPFIGMHQHLVWQIGRAWIWIFTIFLLPLNHFSQAPPKMARLGPLLDFLNHLTFLRQIIYLLSAFWRDDHPIRLNSDFPFNLTWWREVFHSWDSFSFLLSSQWAPLPDFHISSVDAGPLFLCQDGIPLSRSKLSVFLKCTLQSAGVPDNFSSHSFRIRAATTAASWGIPDILLKLLKLWVTGQATLFAVCADSSRHNSLSSQTTCLAGMALIYPFVKLGRVPLDLCILVGAQAFPQPWERSPPRSRLPIVDALGYHRHPNST